MTVIKGVVFSAALWLALAPAVGGLAAEARAVGGGRRNGVAARPVPGPGDRAGTGAGLPANPSHAGRHGLHPRVVVVPFYYPYPHHYAYPYYFVPAVVVNAPFFCVLHQEGYVSRAGMLDHLAGTHKFPLQSAAAMCPDGAPECIFPGY